MKKRKIFSAEYIGIHGAKVILFNIKLFPTDLTIKDIDIFSRDLFKDLDPSPGDALFFEASIVLKGQDIILKKPKVLAFSIKKRTINSVHQ
tara:strand:- start:5195 stop:5467 length:273 start_codon:yes stop_codon:yes gene_type:complete